MNKYVFSKFFRKHFNADFNQMPVSHLNVGSVSAAENVKHITNVREFHT